MIKKTDDPAAEANDTLRESGKRRRRASPPAGTATSQDSAITGPGAKRKRGEVPPDDVRTMVLQRIEERGLTIADISRALNRNDAYMHQFIWRRSPKWLGEVERAVVCRLLDIPQAVLKPPMPETLSPLRGFLPPLSPVGGATQRDIPLLREDDAFDLGAPREWVFRLSGLAPGPIFAVWIATEHERFGPGDTIYVHQRQPPRTGDNVVAIIDRRIASIGRLVGVNAEGQRTIHGAGRDPTCMPVGGSIYKVVAAVFA